MTQELFASGERKGEMMLKPVAGELHQGTNLSLRQVLIRSQEKGGEERLRRPQVGEEAIGTEEEGRVDRLHAQLAQHDLQRRGHAAEFHPQAELLHRRAASSVLATQGGSCDSVLAGATCW